MANCGEGNGKIEGMDGMMEWVVLTATVGDNG